MSELRTGYRVPGCGPARTSRRPSPGLPHAPPRAAPGRHPLPGRGEARGPRAPPRRQFRAPPEGAAGPGATRGRRPRPGRGVRRGGAAAGAAPGPPPPPRPPPRPQAPPSGPGRRSSPEVCGAAGAEAMWLLWLLLGSAGECGRGPSRGAARRRGGVLGAAGEGAGPHVRPRLPAAPGGPGRGPPASPPLLSPPSPPLRFPTSGRAEAAGACGRPGLPSGRARAGGGGRGGAVPGGGRGAAREGLGPRRAAPPRLGCWVGCAANSSFGKLLRPRGQRLSKSASCGRAVQRCCRRELVLPLGPCGHLPTKCGKPTRCCCLHRESLRADGTMTHRSGVRIVKHDALFSFY